MDQWTKDFLREKNEQREKRIESLVSRVLALPCKSCGWKLERAGKTKFRCLACGCGHSIKRKYIPPIPKDPSDENNWKMQCEECSAIARFQRGGEFGAYVCRNGHVYEV